MSSNNRYVIGQKVKLVYFVLPDGKTYSKITLDGFLHLVYKKQVDPKDITVKHAVVTIASQVEHTKKDVGFLGHSGAWQCENQIMSYRQDSLYLLKLIPKNKYDYEWSIVAGHEKPIKAFDALYLRSLLSGMDKRFDPILNQVKLIL